MSFNHSSNHIRMTESEEIEKDCPFCDFDYVHINFVEVNAGGYTTRVDNTGTHVRYEMPAGRGTHIKIGYWCEGCNQNWMEETFFYKGRVFNRFEENSVLDKSDIWRD